MSWLASIRDALHERLAKPAQTAALAQGMGVVAADAAPQAPPPAAIDSPEALQLAMSWLRWLKSRGDTLDAIHQQTVALVEEATRREKDLPELATTIPDLFKRLEAAVLAYARKHDELFAAGATHRLAAGSVKRSKAPPKIELDGEAKEVEKHLYATLRIPELLAELEAADPALGAVARLTRIKCEPDKQAAAAGLKDQTLTAELLALAKMRPAPAGHNYKIEL